MKNNLKNKNILVTGGSGQVGSELKKILPNAIYISSKDVNLTIQNSVDYLFKENNFKIVIHLAAKVGGIIDNINNPMDYYYENILMNTFMLNSAQKYKSERFIGLLSTCIYPDIVKKYPMKESIMHQGPPTPTNFSYGYAKRAMGLHIDLLNKQCGTKYQYLIPCNLYGVHDKFDNRSHFIAALIQKIHNAKINGEKEITLFGTGKPLRQFLHSKDLAKIIKLTLENNITESFNVATPENLSINEMVNIALDVLDCNDIKVKYDSSKPDGQFRKDVDISKFKKHFPNFQFSDLRTGIKEVYESKFK